MRYLIIIARAEGGWSAYAPDIPGCVATGATRDEVIARMREAMTRHLQGLRENSAPIPVPNSAPAYVDVTLSSTLA